MKNSSCSAQEQIKTRMVGRVWGLALKKSTWVIFEKRNHPFVCCLARNIDRLAVYSHGWLGAHSFGGRYVVLGVDWPFGGCLIWVHIFGSLAKLHEFVYKSTQKSRLFRRLKDLSYNWPEPAERI